VTVATRELEEPAETLRELGKRRRRERILAAARELLRQSPDGALTVEAIARRAEVSVPTIFNLIGTRERIWSALADSAVAELDLDRLLTGRDPRDDARAIVDAVITMVCSDAPVFRALLSDWSHSAQVIHHDPTAQLTVCFERVAADEDRSAGLPPRRFAELVSSGLIGILHQWAAGLIGDRAARARARDLVDVIFRAAAGGRS
jgi:AcrR family transcriptional regulator